MENPKKENNISTVELLYYLSGALKNATDGRFLATEHASSIFKRELRKAGFEITRKDNGIDEK